MVGNTGEGGVHGMVDDGKQNHWSGKSVGSKSPCLVEKLAGLGMNNRHAWRAALCNSCSWDPLMSCPRRWRTVKMGFQALLRPSQVDWRENLPSGDCVPWSVCFLLPWLIFTFMSSQWIMLVSVSWWSSPRVRHCRTKPWGLTTAEFLCIH